VDAGQESGTVVVILDGDAGGPVEVVVGSVSGRPVDLELVDALARLQLTARRLGCSIRLREPSQQLHELLDLVGVGGLLTGPDPLPLDAGRQAEGGEHLGVQEVVPPRDPPA